MSQSIVEAIKILVDRFDLTEEQSHDATMEIISGECPPELIGAFLVAMRMKEPSVDEIVGIARAMRSASENIPVLKSDHLLDTCGTGGSGVDRFNVSTTVAVVAAAAGAKVAKHGNRAFTSRSGSADLLEALGVDIQAPLDRVAAALDRIGLTFFFAPVWHRAMKHVGPIRRALGIRTIFNLVGPLTNPAGASAQLLGASNVGLIGKLAEALKRLGSERAYVVSGADRFGANGDGRIGGAVRFDEISISGPTEIAELRDGKITSYSLEPKNFGLADFPIDQIKGGSPIENGEISRAILSGKLGGARHAITVLNAGFALCAAGVANDPHEGIDLARDAIATGAARAKLAELVEFMSRS